MKKEYNLRERAEIVCIALECAKKLSAQPLIDYFQANEHELIVARSGREYRSIPEDIDVETWDAMSPVDRLRYKGLIEKGPVITASDEVIEKIANSMDIHSKHGTQVRLQMKNGDVFGGYDGDKKMALKYLKFDAIYHVEHTEVENWHTDVYLEEVPGIGFNSVMFEHVKY